MNGISRIFSILIILNAFMPAFSQEQKELKNEGNSNIKVRVLHVEGSRYEVAIFSPRSLIENSPSSRSGLTDLAGLIEKKNSDHILISAGFSQYDPFMPAGVLIINGRTLNQGSKSLGESPANFSEAPLNGVLCIDPLGRPDIKRVADYFDRRPNCHSALQAGPIITVFENSRSSFAKSASARVVGCVPHSGSGFDFYFFEQISLRDAEIFLQLKCRHALQLSSGEKASAAVYKNGKLSESYGDINSSAPSVLLIQRK